MLRSEVPSQCLLQTSQHYLTHRLIPVLTNCISLIDASMLAKSEGTSVCPMPEQLHLPSKASTSQSAQKHGHAEELSTGQAPCRIYPNSCTSLSLLPACARALLQDGCPKQQMTDCCLAQWSAERRRKVVRNVLLRGWKMHHHIRSGAKWVIMADVEGKNSVPWTYCISWGQWGGKKRKVTMPFRDNASIYRMILGRKDNQNPEKQTPVSFGGSN